MPTFSVREHAANAARAVSQRLMCHGFTLGEDRLKHFICESVAKTSVIIVITMMYRVVMILLNTKVLTL